MLNARQAHDLETMAIDALRIDRDLLKERLDKAMGILRTHIATHNERAPEGTEYECGCEACLLAERVLPYLDAALHPDDDLGY